VQRASAQRIDEPGLARTPRDIDVGGLESSQRFATRAEQRINAAVGESLVGREGSTVRSQATGEELFDLHEVGEMTGGESPSLFGRDTGTFGIREAQTVRTSEGVETATLPEQTRREGMGATETISREPGQTGPVEGVVRPAHEGRVKDIADFYLGEQANIEALRLQGQGRSAQRAETALEDWIGAFGDEAAQRARSELELTQAGERPAPRTQLADFGSPAASPGGVFGDAPAFPAGAIGGPDAAPAPSDTPASPSPPEAGIGPDVFDSPSPAVADVDSQSPGVLGAFDQASSVVAAGGDRSPAPAGSPAPDSPSIGLFGQPSGLPGSAPPDSPPPSVPGSPTPAVPESPPPSTPPSSPPPSTPPGTPTAPPPLLGVGTGGDGREFEEDESRAPETPLFHNPIADVWPPEGAGGGGGLFW